MKKLKPSQILSLLGDYDTRVSICIGSGSYGEFSESIEDINLLKGYFEECEIEEISKGCFVVKLYGLNTEGIRN